MVVQFTYTQSIATVQAMVALWWMAIAITLYEQVALFSFDWSIITGKRRRRTIHIAYFAAKVAWWCYMVLIMIRYYTAHEVDCNANMIAVQVLMGVVNTCASILLACRAVCVYRGKTRTYITYGLVVGTLGLAAAWAAGTQDVVMAWVEAPLFPWASGSCDMVAVKTQYFVKYLITILYDLAVLLLTVGGVVQMTRGGSSRIGTVLIEQGAFYFLAVFVVNLPVLVLTAAQTGPLLAIFFAVPSAAVSLCISTRMYVQLANEAAHKPGGISNEQLSSQGSVSEKVINFFTRRRSSLGRRGSAADTSHLCSQDTANNTHKGSTGQLGYMSNDSASIDLEKQRVMVPAVLPSSRRSATQPFSSLPITEAKPTPKSPSKSRYLGRAHPQTTSLGSLDGVQVTQTQTIVEEPMPEYLVHPGFLNEHELNTIQPDGEEARRTRDPVAAQYPHLLSSSKNTRQ